MVKGCQRNIRFKQTCTDQLLKEATSAMVKLLKNLLCFKENNVLLIILRCCKFAAGSVCSV